MSETNKDQDFTTPPPLTSAQQRQRDRRRRRREMIAAAIAFCLVLLLTSLQLEQYRSGSGTAFFILFNVNFVLLAGILFIVVRNGIKLLLERRRKVFGSRLRTRLVLYFVILALFPCVLMFLVTTQYVRVSMDFWFRLQMESSMETALDVGRASYDRYADDMAFQAESIQSEIAARGYSWEGRDMDLLFEMKRREYQLAILGLYSEDKAERVWHAREDAALAWNAALSELDWESVKGRGLSKTMAAGRTSDYLFVIYRTRDHEGEFFVMAKDMGKNFREDLANISRGASEYKSMRSINKPLKLMLYSSLGILTMLILMGAVWFAFRLARELSAPMLALVSGTQSIARGDLSVRLEDSSEDELGVLIRSFNTMAEDLDTSRQVIINANSMLEEQNIRIAGHSSYIETVLDNIAAGVISFNNQGEIGTTNRAAAAMLGFEASEVLGKKIYEVLPPEYRAAITQEMLRLSQSNEKSMRYNAKLNIDGEQRHLLINVVRFSTEGVLRGSVVFFEDITELERMQRMAAWREVAKRIAHEIKNPLTPIKLSAQRIAKKFGAQVQDPAFSQSIDLIVKQVEHLQGMVQEFSAFAKLPEVVPVPGDISPLLTSIADLFKTSHGWIKWEVDIPDGLPRIYMDQEALHRAFMNILTNAAEALEQSGTAEPFVRISARHDHDLGLIRIEVEDNGPGLTEEELSRLFEPYFSHKKGGTGLGLSIVRSIIADHRGYVRAVSREDGGTALVVELPLA